MMMMKREINFWDLVFVFFFGFVLLFIWKLVFVYYDFFFFRLLLFCVYVANDEDDVDSTRKISNVNYERAYGGVRTKSIKYRDKNANQIKRNVFFLFYFFLVFFPKEVEKKRKCFIFINIVHIIFIYIYIFYTYLRMHMAYVCFNDFILNSIHV